MTKQINLFYNANMEKLLTLSRVAFSIGNFDIYWYGIIMASAILVAFLLAIVLYKKKGKDANFAFEAFLAVVISGIIGARLFSVVMDGSIADFFKFREGGMSIIGAVLFGALGLGILSLIRKKNFFEYSDVVVVVLILAQAIGRWGNYVNEEVYGKVITNQAWQFFPFGVQIDGTWHYALFFYEFVLNLLGFGLLLFLLLKFNKKGLTTGVYLLYYGIIRTILEPMRDDSFILKYLGAPISQIVAFVMISIGSTIVFGFIADKIIAKKNKKAKSKGEKNV